MVKKIVVLFLFALFSSCRAYYTPRRIKNNFNLCYFNKSLRSSVNTDGYYTDLKHLHYIFFDDGIFLSDFPDGYYDSLNNYINYKSIEDAIQLIKSDSNNLKQFQNNSTIWGLYEIIGDTIKTNYIANLGITAKAKEEWFRIIDNNTLVRVFIQPINNSKMVESLNSQYETGIIKNIDTVKFISLSEMPSSDCWIKKEKWFWCNEKDWQHYIDSITVSP